MKKSRAGFCSAFFINFRSALSRRDKFRRNDEPWVKPRAKYYTLLIFLSGPAVRKADLFASQISPLRSK